MPWNRKSVFRVNYLERFQKLSSALLDYKAEFHMHTHALAFLDHEGA